MCHIIIMITVMLVTLLCDAQKHHVVKIKEFNSFGGEKL